MIYVYDIVVNFTDNFYYDFYDYKLQNKSK